MSHLGKKLLCTWVKVFCPESYDCGMIRNLPTPQQIHIVDAPPAVLLYGSRGCRDHLVICIDHELYHNILRRVIFCQHSFIGTVQSSLIHFLHKLTDESHTIIEWDDIAFHVETARILLFFCFCVHVFLRN